MRYEKFTDWLKGFVEIANDRPTKAQWMMIKENLRLVYVGTPEMKIYFPDPVEKKEEPNTFKAKLDPSTFVARLDDEPQKRNAAND